MQFSISKFKTAFLIFICLTSHLSTSGQISSKFSQNISNTINTVGVADFIAYGVSSISENSSDSEREICLQKAIMDARTIILLSYGASIHLVQDPGVSYINIKNKIEESWSEKPDYSSNGYVCVKVHSQQLNFIPAFSKKVAMIKINILWSRNEKGSDNICDVLIDKVIESAKKVFLINNSKGVTSGYIRLINISRSCTYNPFFTFKVDLYTE